MKKLLIAAAAVSCLGLAHADEPLGGIVFYGLLDQAAFQETRKVGGTTVYDKTGFYAVEGASRFGIKGSRDVAGMKAGFVLLFGTSADSGSGLTTNRTSIVTLSGGFGGIRVGRQYSQGYLNMEMADPGVSSNLVGNLSAFADFSGVLGSIDGGSTPGRYNNQLQYDLPQFYPGLKLGVTKVFGETNTSGSTTGNQAKEGDGMGFNANYKSGPVYVGYTYDEMKNRGIYWMTTPQSDDAGTKKNATERGVDPDNYTIANASSTDKNKLTTLSASYDFGPAKASINNSKISVGSAAFENTFVAVNVPVGQADLWASVGSGKATSAASKKDDPTESFQMGVFYNFDKQTQLYAQYGSQSWNTTKKQEQTGSAIGLRYKF